MHINQRLDLGFFLRGGAARSIVPNYRFLDAQTFTTPNGGYGMFLRIVGLDEETMTRAELNNRSDSMRLAIALLPEHLSLFAYARTRGGCAIEHHPESGPAKDRTEHLRTKAGFRSVELRWCIYSNPPRRLPEGKTARAKEQGRRLRDLRQNVAMIRAQLKHLAPRVMNEHEVGEFLSSLLNLEPRLTVKQLSSRKGVAAQLMRATIDWTEDHDGLRIGKRHVQMFSLIKNPVWKRPNLWGELLSLDCDLDVCQEWRRASNAAVRKEVADQEGFLGMIKHRLQTTVMHAIRKKEIEETASSKSTRKGVTKLSGVLDHIDDEGFTYGSFSMIGMLHSRSLEQIDEALPELHRVISDPSWGAVMEESIGGMAAYQALFPGNGRYNVRRRWLLDDAYVNLAFVYQPFLGHVRSDDLGGESLTVLQTLDKTPFYFDPYYNGVRGLLVIGPTGSGKSMLGNLFVDHDSKNGGFTTVYDIGGSYNSTILSHGGLVTRVGLDGPRFNPFSLEPTPKNVRAIYLLILLLLRKGGYAIAPTEERDVFERVKTHYWMEPAVRRLGCFILPDHMMPYLSKWTGEGVYGHIFDNAVDELDLAKFQAFDFEEIGGEQSDDHRDLIEPMLFWLTYLKECQRQKPEYLALPKHDVFDELWKQIKEPRMWSFILGGLKTARKRLGGVTLLTQHPDDLGDYAGLVRNACQMTAFTGDPILPHDQYLALFHMNEVEIAAVESLRQRHFFLKAPWGSKTLMLDVDPKAYARYSTTPREIKRRMELVGQHGLEKGIELLAEELTV